MVSCAFSQRARAQPQAATSMRKSALALAADGFRVFRLRTGTKAGTPKAWPKIATTDASTIAKWWRDDAATGNIAIATGTHYVDGKPRHFFVLDIDNKDGKNGSATLAALEAEHGALPETLTVKTPSGGFHLYFHASEPVGTNAGKVGEAVDVRGCGGFVVGPGSTLADKRYTAESNAEIANCPAWLEALLPHAGASAGKPRAGRLGKLPGIDPERAEKRALKLLSEQPAAEQGKRNDMGYDVANLLKDCGIDEGQCVALMLERWQCEPMLDLNELQLVVGSAYANGQNPQGSAAPEAQFTAVEVDDPAPTWNADKIRAEASAIYTLHGRDSVAYNKLAQCWTMLDVIEPGELNSLLADAALASVGVGPAAAAASTPEDAKLQRGLAMLQAKNPEAYGWARDALEAHGMPKRASANAAKAGSVSQATERNTKARHKDGRVLIMYQSGNLAATVDDIEQALLADDVHERVFKHAGGYVSVRHAAPVTVRELAGGGEYPPMAILHRYDVHSLGERISRTVRLEMPRAEDAPPKAINPSEQAVRMMLARGGGLAPTIAGIIEAPTVRPDGSLLADEGYDVATGLLATFGGQAFAIDAALPTKDDAARALAFLQNELFAEFPFADPVDCTAAVAAVITGMMRPTLCGSAPGFLLSSPTQSTGKTALAQTICHAAYGRPAPATSWPGSEEEMSKFLLGALREGQRSVVFDNLPDGTVINNAELAAAMTSDTYSRRLLGSHEHVTVPTAVLWMITGNNARPAGDMPSRLVEIYLDAKAERPDQRKFTRDLVPWVNKHRGLIVEAALVIVRAYIAAGCPDVTERPSRFPKWDRMVRLPLVFAGGVDVVIKFDKAYAGDPGLEAWREVLTLWRDVFGDKEIKAKELAELTGNGAAFDVSRNALETALRDIAGAKHRELTAKTLGRCLSQYENRQLGGFRLTSRIDRNRSKIWCVEGAATP
jgi:hypothetical protein